MKDFFKNFFRSDLGLSNHWLHRFVVVVFVGICLFLGYITIADISGSPMVPYWKNTSTIEDRMTSEVMSLREMLKDGEVIALTDYGRTYGRTSSDTKNRSQLSMLDNYYCSRNIVNQIEDVKIKSGINTLSAYPYAPDSVSLDVLKKDIIKYNDKCLKNGSEIFPGISILLPTSGPFTTDFSFFHKSLVSTILFVFINWVLPAVGLIFAIIVLYYKVVLYIIFGKYKK